VLSRTATSMSAPLSLISSLKAGIAQAKAEKGKRKAVMPKEKENKQPEADKKKKVSVE
jgi:hypothetical protein